MESGLSSKLETPIWDTYEQIIAKYDGRGKVLNQSVALAKAGLKVFHAGAIGENDGQFLAYDTRKILPPEMPL